MWNLQILWGDIKQSVYIVLDHDYFNFIPVQNQDCVPFLFQLVQRTPQELYEIVSLIG